jgi:hypothetical protein
MKKTKVNPQLLNEELKKFKLLSEYAFYGNTTEEPEYEKPLVLGSNLEEEEEEGATDAIAADLGLEPSDEKSEDQPSDEEQTGDIPTEEPETPEDEEPTDEPTDEPIEEPIEEPSNEVEVDVTSLVKGSEEAKAAADKATANTEMLLQKLSDLESRVASMDNITTKIEDLEKEIVKRNPTPVEKLEMRSLSSYPYNQKLTDYWADKEGPYNVMGGEKEKEEFVLTQKDVDYDYSEPQIKKSFGVSPDDYEEEEI